ncbi:hypothetical protein BD779DRAFT_1442157 [Infundibulicybe gibba]|nr:hypothetical protein BD779DRAFT_1442157 [Infundibulicybe gibba]
MSPQRSSRPQPRRNQSAMASFENLVALANHQERLREARKMVWRDRGEPVAEIDGWRECVVHAASGGFRSGGLAFIIRACVNIVLAAIRIHRVPRDLRFSVIRHAIFGTDTWRFATMLGTFTSVYKFLLNALPLLIPAINPAPSPLLPARADPKPHLSAHAQLAMVRKRTRRWHAALAGLLAGGLAIGCEKRNRRGIIAQQMFVRGLQGSYNAYTTKRGIHVPHGDVLVFSLACGQILYGFLLRPDSLPRSYTNWIGQAAKVPRECVRMNFALFRSGTCNPGDIDALLRAPGTTPSNYMDLLRLRDRLFPSVAQGVYIPNYAPCSAIHPLISSCLSVPLDRFFAVSKWMLPIYGALHIVPAVLFKREAFTRDPGSVLLRASLGAGRSSAFLGVFVVIYQTLNCFKHQLHHALTTLSAPSTSASPLLLSLLRLLPRALLPSQWLADLLVSRASFWIPGFMAGLALFIEEKRRRAELAMYVLPKGLESVWRTARGRGWVRGGWGGDRALTALGMAMVMSAYQNDPQHLSGFVRRILYQFIGPN